VVHLLILPQELNHCGHRVAECAQALAEAAMVERLPRPSNQLPMNLVGHEESSSITTPNMASQLVM
jgi:hypothetical protein